MTNNVYLVWLEWPEKCFRVDAEALSYLEKSVPAGAKVIRARTRTGFMRSLKTATHVITWYFEEAWFPKAPRLKVLATPSAGKELLPQSGPEGVKIHFGAFHGEIMAESVAAFALAWRRGFFERRRYPDGVWPRTEMGGSTGMLAGTRAVIVGYGNVGRAVGAKLESLGVKTAGFSRTNIKNLPKAAKNADWFIMVLPSTTGTDGFLDARLLKKLPEKCVVVNVGRGNSLDEKALLEALEKGRIAGAYLDVIKSEPSSYVEPGVKTPVYTFAGKKGPRLPWNLVIMPHSSAFSPDYIKACFRELHDDGLL